MEEIWGHEIVCVCVCVCVGHWHLVRLIMRLAAYVA